MTTCPACGQRGIGKVGNDQFFCWECCVEFVVQGSTVKVFHVEPDGTLTLMAQPLTGAVNLQEG